MTINEFLNKFLSWFGVLLFLLFGLFYYGLTYSVLVFLVTLLGVLLCAPPSRHFLLTRSGISLSRRGKAKLIFGVFAVQAWVGLWQNVEATDERLARSERESLLALENARTSQQGRFLTAKPALMAEIIAKRDQGLLDEALALINKSAAGRADPDFGKLRISIQILQTEAGLKNEAAMPLRQRLAIYMRLVALDPSNARFVSRVAMLDAQLRESSAREQAETERFSAAHGREAMLARQFDKRSGAHLKLQAEIKRTMLNPASYQHVETTNLDTGTGVSVWTTFRGKNAAGETVENSVAATVDDSGNVRTLED